MQSKKMAFGCLVLLAVFAYFCSGNILRQGQEIKQFHAFGITKALTENHFDIVHTYVPCEDTRNHTYPRPWAEEPPLFHIFAALLQKTGFTGPQWPGYFISAATCLLAFYLIYYLYPGPSSFRLALLMIPLTTPVFLRYFSEHLPEGLAVLFFFGAVIAYLKHTTSLLLVFLTLSVTAKAFSIFPAATLLFWVYFSELKTGDGLGKTFKAVLYHVGSLGLIAAPFLVWLWVLDRSQIPNPFDFSLPFQNRHSGGWGILVSAEYWDRVFTFMGTKGVGWPLFIAYGAVVVGMARSFRTLDRFHGALFFWSLGFLPFWFFVRAASIIHDHYVLQYFYPMAFLGTERILQLPKPKLKGAFLTVTCVMGLTNPVIWRLRVRGDAPPPSHCDQEEHSLRRFRLPTTKPN